MLLNTTRKILANMNALQKDDNVALDTFINNISPDISRTLLNELLNEEPVNKYLTNKKKFPNGERLLIIKPVNVIRYELLNRRINGVNISLQSDVVKFKNDILDKRTNSFLFLPNDVVELIHLHGGGPNVKATQGAFQSWTDNRKFLMPFLMTKREKNEINEELKALGRNFIERLSIDGLSADVKTPEGSQSNSYNDYCWIAFSPNEGMKNSIHLGMRIYENCFRIGLHVGENLQEILKNKKIKFPYDLVDGGSFEMSIAFHTDEAIDQLINLKKTWKDLNQLFNSSSYEELTNYKPKKINVENRVFMYTQNLTTDSSRLQNTEAQRSIIIDPQTIESKYLYLVKIEGINFEAKEGYLYKIGVTSSPEDRYANIALGTGIRSLIKIQELICLEKSGQYEKRIKESLIKNTGVYYDGEFFITKMNPEEVSDFVFSIING